MKKLALLLILVVSLSFAADPENIIVKYDNYVGYGPQLLTALGNLWPDANVQAHEGNTWGAFGAALAGGDWDMVVVEAHNYYDFESAAMPHLLSYYNDGAGPLFYIDWNMGTAGALLNAMGVTGHSGISMPPVPMYTWDETHPITDGITDWTYSDPGYGTGARRLTVSDAVPITGWTAAEQAGQAGICIANDGYSIASGYFPSLKTTGAVELWETILTFMWDAFQPDYTVVETSWGSIKAF